MDAGLEGMEGESICSSHVQLPLRNDCLQLPSFCRVAYLLALLVLCTDLPFKAVYYATVPSPGGSLACSSQSNCNPLYLAFVFGSGSRNRSSTSSDDDNGPASHGLVSPPDLVADNGSAAAQRMRQ